MNHALKKRRNTRIYYCAPITIEESGVPFLYRARLVNYSISGVYFETDLLLYPEANVYIGIEDSTHQLFSEDCGSFFVEIIWRKRLNDISFNYGYGAKIAFDQPHQKLQSSSHVKLKELRIYPRRTSRKPAYFSFENKYYQGVIKNISRGGAFIESEAKFSNGDKLKLVVQGVGKYALLKGEVMHFNLSGFGIKFKSLLRADKLPVTPKSSIQ
jgi:hypothetical protein